MAKPLKRRTNRDKNGNEKKAKIDESESASTNAPTIDHFPRNPDGTFKSQWRVGDYVQYKIGGNLYVDAKVKHFVEDGPDIDHNRIKSKVILQWIDESGTERIATVYSNKYSSLLSKIDAIERFLGDKPERLIYIALKSMLSKKETLAMLQRFHETNSFTFDMLFETASTSDENSTKPLQAISALILKSDGAKETMKEVFGDNVPENGLILASLGYLTGNMIGFEIQHEQMKDTRDHDDSGYKDSNESNYYRDLVKSVARYSSEGMKSQFDDLRCNITKVFLHGVMNSRIVKSTSRRQPFLDKRTRLTSKGNQSSHIETKSQQMLTIISCLHALQTHSSRGLGILKVIRGLILYLDKKGGTSDKVLNQLNHSGLTLSPKELRNVLHKVAEKIDPNSIREDYMNDSDEVPILMFTFDNADYHHYSNVVSMIVAGTVQIGTESKEIRDMINSGYIKDLPVPSEDDAKKIMPTENDDKIAQKGINLQNIAALYNAYLCGQVSDDTDSHPNHGSVQGSTSCEFEVGTEVEFNLRTKRVKGQIIAVDGQNRTVVYVEENGDDDEIEVHTNSLRECYGHSEDVNSMNDVILQKSSEDTRASDQTSQTESTSFDESLSESAVTLSLEEEGKQFVGHVSGTEDGGRRRKIKPGSTVVTDVLSGVSSKSHWEATKTVTDRQEQMDPEYFKKVHNMSTDQEFIPSLFTRLFMSQHSSDEHKKPYILGVAWGHLHKNIVVSMFKYYSCIFDELMKAQGIKIGSPAYKRIVNGQNIKASIKWMVNALETLRMAQAKEYLNERGNDQCIQVERGAVISKETPNGIISAALIDKNLFVSNLNKVRHEIVLDINARPQAIPVPDNVWKIVSDFNAWIDEKTYGQSRPQVYTGPSGFIYAPNDEELEKARNVSLADNRNDAIPEEVEKCYHYIWNIPYTKAGDEIGLYNRCKQENLLNCDSKITPVLAMKYYLYKKHTAHTGDAEVGRRIAREWDPEKDQMKIKMADDVCPTRVVLKQLLQGSESHALIIGFLFTRWFPPIGHDREDEWETTLMSSLDSVYKRNQKFYQGIVLNQLILIRIIKRHPDKSIARGALNRIRQMISVSRKGDSWLCEPGDMIQETDLIAIAKIKGGDPNSDKMLASRILFQSLMNAFQIEEAAKDYTLRNSASEMMKKRIEEEDKAFKNGYVFWNGLLSSVHESSSSANKKERDRIAGTNFRFRSLSRLMTRDIDSAFYKENAALTFCRGLMQGIEVSLPPRSRLAMTTLHKDAAGATAATASKTIKRRQKITAKVKARQNAEFIKKHVLNQTPCHIPVHPENSAFKSLDCVGERKSNILPSFMALIESNACFEYENRTRLGPYGTRPIQFSRDASIADSRILARCGNNRPVIVLVDILKDLQCAPVRRKGTKYPYTIIELARDIITYISWRYSKSHVNMVVALMDVESECTELRKLVRKKRNKIQDVGVHLETKLKFKSSKDLLSSFGDFHYLMSYNKSTFTPFLAREIVNQLKSKDDPSVEWFPSVLFQTCVLGFIGGGSEDCCAFVGPANPNITSTLTIPRKTIQSRLKKIVKQGEGERMIFSVIHRLITLSFCTKADSHMDACFEIHCEDSDATGGMSMFFVHSLHETLKKYKDQQTHKFTGSIIVRGHNQTVGAIMRLNKSLISDLNINLDLQSKVSGNGWIFQLDLISLYYHLEDFSKLSHLKEGHRAIAVTSSNYCFSNNDYLASYGESHYNRYIQALLSNEYKKCIEMQDIDDVCSPVVIYPVMFDTFDDPEQVSCMNLCGVVILFTIIMMKNDRTSAQLRRVYPNKDEMFKRFFDRHSSSKTYATVRAATVLSGEEHGVPDALALLSRIACANRVFHQMNYNVYQDNVTPSVGLDELKSTPYIIPHDIEITNDPCKIDYGILSLYTPALKKRMKQNGFDEYTRQLFRDNLYGEIFDKCQLSQNRPWMFDVSGIIKETIQNNGITPTDVVSGSELVPELQARTFEEFEEKLNKYEAHARGSDNSLQCLEILKDIISLALASKTEFRLKNEGRPQLLSNNARAVSKGWRKDGKSWDVMEIPENTHQSFMDLKMKDIYEKLGTDKDHESTIQFIRCLVKHVFEKSSSNGLRLGDGQIPVHNSELEDTTEHDDNDEEHLGLSDAPIEACSSESGDTIDRQKNDEDDEIAHLFFTNDSDNDQSNDDSVSVVQDNYDYASDENESVSDNFDI